MTFDLFKQLKLSPGQQVESQDLMDGYNFVESKIMDQLLSNLGTSGIDGGISPEASLEMQNVYAYALTIQGARPGGAVASANGSVRMAPGVLYQKIGTATGTTPSVLAYKFAGTEEVSFTNGNASNPRVDIIQMSLSLVSSDIQSRPHLVPGTSASISCGSFTTHVNSVIQARVTGIQGNSISLALSPDGSGAGSVTVVGATVTFHFQSGVTTVADFESIISASTQSLLSVKTIGTASNIFISGVDTLIPTLLTGGVNTVIVNSVGLATKTRVNCTLSVKQGTPAASPQYPTPDVGCVMIAGMLIGTNWVASTGWGTFDQAGANATLHDQRIPICVGYSDIYPDNFHYDTTKWSLTASRELLVATSGADSGAGANAIYRGTNGRLLGVAATSINVTTGPIAGALSYKIVMYEILSTFPTSGYSVTPGIGSGGIGSTVTLGDVDLAASGFISLIHKYRHFTAITHLPSVGPIVTTNGQGVTAPIWCTGSASYRCPNPDSVATGAQATGQFNRVAVSAQPGNAGGFHGQNIAIGPVTFWVATGLS